jgi:hypothetical protein
MELKAQNEAARYAMQELVNRTIAQALETLYATIHTYARKDVGPEHIAHVVNVVRTAGFRVRSVCDVPSSFSGQLADEPVSGALR